MLLFAGFRRNVCAGVVLLVVAGSGHGQDTSVEVDTVRARVQPDLEIELPSGIIEQKSTIPVGNAAFAVESTIDFVTGSIAGDVSLNRYFRSVSLAPFVSLGVDASTEPPLVPETTETVDRSRHVRVGTDWSIAASTFQLSVELREDTRFSYNGDASQTLDLFPTVAWEVSDLRPALPSQTPETVGGWFRLEFTQRAHVDSSSAVDLRGRIAGLLHHRAFERWRWRHRMELYSPLVVWNRARSERVGLGGFDSVRGFDEGAIRTRRGVFSANTASFNLGSDDETGDTIEHIRFHSLRALAVGDVALYQNSHDLTAIPRAMAGVGTGIATTVSAPGGIHLDMEAYVTIPVEAGLLPVIYVRSSLFSLATDIDDVDG
ncbi:MAG: hypothetical protein ACOCYB_11785 [Alkalispirochaeta sp.]